MAWILVVFSALTLKGGSLIINTYKKKYSRILFYQQISMSCQKIDLLIKKFPKVLLIFLRKLMESQSWKAGVLRQCQISTFPNRPPGLLECNLNSSIPIRKTFKIWFTSPVLSTLSLPIPHVTYRAQTGFLSSSATSCLINVHNKLQFFVVVHSILSHFQFWSPS